MAARSYGQYCGVTTAVELVAERWALLIIRDLLVGPRRYTDLSQGLPKIPTNILSARLKELRESGVIRRVPLARCGLVYELTEYGRELEPVVLALGRWGFRSIGEPKDGDIVTADSLTIALRSAFRPAPASRRSTSRFRWMPSSARPRQRERAEGGPDRSRGAPGGRLAAQRRT